MTTILLVDDHNDIRDMMACHLQKRGYAVVTANNGIEAVLAANQSLPSLILMDINMPELDGFEGTMQVHAANTDNRIPILS